MSDDEVRELERRWRASGSDADEAAYLVARLRAGTLDRAQVELLARLGHAAAVLATGVRAAPQPTTMNELEEWVREALVPGGLQGLVRGALVVLGDFCRELVQPRTVDPRDGRLRVANALVPVIAAAEDWSVCPCSSHASQAAAAANHAEEETANSGRVGVLVHTGAVVARAITEHETPKSTDTARAQAVDGLVDVCLLRIELDRPPIGVTTERVLHELSGWILGPVDPIAERVRTRHV